MKAKLFVVAMLVMMGALVMGGQALEAQAQDQGAVSTAVLAADSAQYVLPSGEWAAGSRVADAGDGPRYVLPSGEWAAGVAARGAASSDPLAIVRRSTASYHRIETAEQGGFVPLFDCIANLSDAAQGAMGIHYILPSRFDDELNLDEPEVLIYEPQADGRMRLVAVEYVVPSVAWPEDADPPEFLGQELKYKTTMGKYGKEDGVDPYYELHVWVWDHNPSGMFEDWNPTVSCSS